MSANADQLFPLAGLLPLGEPGGGQTPMANRPDALRPFIATLAIPAPRDGKKHDTNSSRWTENKPTQYSNDGKVEHDTEPVVYTDT